MTFLIIAIFIVVILALVLAGKWGPAFQGALEERAGLYVALAAIAAIIRFLSRPLGSFCFHLYKAFGRPQWLGTGFFLTILLASLLVVWRLVGREIAVLAGLLIITTAGIAGSFSKLGLLRLRPSRQAMLIGILIGSSLGWMVVMGALAAVVLEELSTPLPTPTLTPSTSQPTESPTPTVTAVPSHTKSVCDGVPESQLARHPQATHQVKEREYLSAIAERYGTTIDALREANREIHPEIYQYPDCVRVGVWLIVPTPAGR